MLPERWPEMVPEILPKIMQNLVVLMESTEDTYDVSSRAGNMCLNRFCIDEEAAFELSGVVYWKPHSFDGVPNFTDIFNKNHSARAFSDHDKRLFL